MKRILFIPLLSLLFATVGCTKEETVVVQSSSYVYTVYPQVYANEWEESYNMQDNGTGSGTYTINYLYYTYADNHISQPFLENSFLLTYYVDENEYDVPLPAVIHSADGLHSAIVRYDVQLGSVTFILESLDDDYNALRNFVPETMSFKVCMMMY